MGDSIGRTLDHNCRQRHPISSHAFRREQNIKTIFSQFTEYATKAVTKPNRVRVSKPAAGYFLPGCRIKQGRRTVSLEVRKMRLSWHLETALEFRKDVGISKNIEFSTNAKHKGEWNFGGGGERMYKSVLSPVERAITSKSAWQVTWSVSTMRSMKYHKSDYECAKGMNLRWKIPVDYLHARIYKNSRISFRRKLWRPQTTISSRSLVSNAADVRSAKRLRRFDKNRARSFVVVVIHQ